MDKNAIKKYAIWARNELIARVTQKAEQYEITEKKMTPKDAESINGRLLTDAEKNQRKALIEKIQTDGFEQVMEEVAYTWFNRFTALRFMEVNNYLPSHTRVFTNEAGEFKPQILTDAIQLELDGLDMDKVFELKDANKTEELYKYLLITQCNALSAVLPRMFQKIEHYTELLLPDYLLREGSVIEQMITLIPEEDWTDQVQIIGWLYQYYNSEPKDAVFAALKKNVKISKENIPAATQMFTPDWIVRYMVENSLGRLWLEGHPNDTLKSEWKYYLDEAVQEADVQKQLDEIHKVYAEMKPEEIRCIDPCVGSGHILCYMFDVLVKIYEDYGYTAREAVGNIVEKNLWGLDIDERAAQLSYFAVMMKARQYDRRFLTRGIQPHVYAIEESNGITSAPMHDMGIDLSQEEYGEAVKQAMRLVEEMKDAKEYGSLIHVTACDWNLLRRFAIPRGVSEGQLRLDIHGEINAAERLQTLINIGETLAQEYSVVTTNPPYMGGSGMNGKLSKYVKENYPDSKADMFSCMMEKCMRLTSINGITAVLTSHSWMFLPSFESMRSNIITSKCIGSLLWMDTNVWGCSFGTSATCIRNVRLNYTGRYVEVLAKDIEDDKPFAFPITSNRNAASKMENYKLIPGEPIVYWATTTDLKIFNDNGSVEDKSITRHGMTTGNNKRFLRLWSEVNYNKIGFSLSSTEEAEISRKKWFPYNKGGAYRRWYGNADFVVNYENDGAEVKEFTSHLPQGTWVRIMSREYYFRPSVTWSICGGTFGVRYCPKGFIFDVGGSSLFPYEEDNYYYLLGLLNSKVASFLLEMLNPTVNMQTGNLKNVPYIEDRKDEVTALVEECIRLSKQDWDSFETSWGFKRSPLLPQSYGKGERIKDYFQKWQQECEERFSQLKSNEERLNDIFIGIYGLQNELDYHVADDDVTVRKADLSRDIKSFLSYSVGCMFGRYSLDMDGIAYAGGEWDASNYTVYAVDTDGILPICDDEYFDDDIVAKFAEFVETVYGRETLEENLKYISDALGGTGSPREIIRNYFMTSFYVDHCTEYSVLGAGQRPIYWLFDSGKKNGFKCLIYVHRYQSDTIARIRTDYIHEQQSRYRTAISDYEKRVSGATTSERVKYTKHLNALQAQAKEIREYEEKIHHLADQMISINLDDGVKHNYEIFKDVLAKIK